MRVRPYVTGPDGRQWVGRWPQNLGRHGEAPYIQVLARQLGGVPEVVLPAGRADVATSTDVFEVEPVGSWLTGAQQAFAYSAMSGMAANLALFGSADYLKIFLRIRDRMPGLRLWVWHYGDFELVGSRRVASRKSLGTGRQPKNWTSTDQQTWSQRHQAHIAGPSSAV